MFVLDPVMTLEKALEDISNALGRLQHQISLENAAGFLSRNKILENVLLPVLAKTYDLPHLRNVNRKLPSKPVFRPKTAGIRVKSRRNGRNKA